MRTGKFVYEKREGLVDDGFYNLDFIPSVTLQFSSRCKAKGQLTFPEKT